MEASKKVRVIAFYLPQYHPIPENDKWWGKGFTEWTNVAKAKPLFKGHYQPKIPADLGFYDLRLSEVREAQAEMAINAGVEGFAYWHYWFGNGRQLLDGPFNEVLASGKPDFPFCVGWANHSWTNKTWIKGKTLSKDFMIAEQLYPGTEDHILHFKSLLPAFNDRRYIKVDGKPLFVIYDPLSIPECDKFISLWQNLAVQNGLLGIHFVAVEYAWTLRKRIFEEGTDNTLNRYTYLRNIGFNAINSRNTIYADMMVDGKMRKYFRAILNKITKSSLVTKYGYSDIVKYLFTPEDSLEYVYPTIIPNWDRTPRSGREAIIYHNSTPELFQKHIEKALDHLKEKDDEHKILFLQSWNEWGEGNYVEPDLMYGHGYLEALKKSVF